MDRKTAAEFPSEVLQLFDGYVHGTITRREFLDRAARYATAGVTAAAMPKGGPTGCIAGAVPYYGAQPKAEDAAKIRAPILAHTRSSSNT